MQNNTTTSESVNAVRQIANNVTQLKRLQKNKHAVMKLMWGRHLKCRHLYTYQSQAEIGKILGDYGGRAIGRRAMVRLMKYLVEHGYLVAWPRSHKGRQTTNLYRVSRKGAHYYNQHLSVDSLIDMEDCNYFTLVPKHSTDLSTKIEPFSKNDTPPNKKRHTSYSDHNIYKNIINTRGLVDNLRDKKPDFFVKSRKEEPIVSEIGRGIGYIADDDPSPFAQIVRRATQIIANRGEL